MKPAGSGGGGEGEAWRDEERQEKESERAGACVLLSGVQLHRVSASECVIARTQHKAGPRSVLLANRRLWVKDRLLASQP